ncbi:arsenate reductase (glutaredoxin) [Galbibacter sp. BG1]|uniref:arsenate reductase (glutaredoxin) n=1 Tax=Galbibacter sp. BG1 TaxID=1170699 RepID=UPI0015C18D49|nr:arsenate reductase (glutaredoxin) [Galbibacter sp. BG1]QLE02946.1 arsenate reductase (glutaredoxin) [Galbibacter sp. BG1]
MIKIYHNPRCKKSREGLQIVEESGKEYEVVKYLEDVPSEKELREILNCLDIKPINLVRKNETVWKENYKNKSLTDDEVIEAMLANPKLIERPIVMKNDVAVIGRPPENIKGIL